MFSITHASRRLPTQEIKALSSLPNLQAYLKPRDFEAEMASAQHACNVLRISTAVNGESIAPPTAICRCADRSREEPLQSGLHNNHHQLTTETDGRLHHDAAKRNLEKRQIRLRPRFTARDGRQRLENTRGHGVYHEANGTAPDSGSGYQSGRDAQKQREKTKSV